MKSVFLPAALSALTFFAALYAGVTGWHAQGAVPDAAVGLLFAAAALGVMTQRLYEMQKEIERLRGKAAESGPKNPDEP